MNVCTSEIWPQITITLHGCNLPFVSIAPCTDGQVRLVGATVSYEGRVEVCLSSEWGSVCDNDWGDLDAAVVCSQAGFLAHGV